METIFKETKRFSLPTDSPVDRPVVEAEVRAVYDDTYGVLCVDLNATHTSGCQDDGSPSGCRFCAPFFPREERKLLDLSQPGKDRAFATRTAIALADEYYAQVKDLVRQAKERGPLQLEVNDG